MPAKFGIVDLFAGPGGLGEGFSCLKVGDHAPFHIGISVEKEASAHRTLRLRAFLREHQARHSTLPQAFVDFHAGISDEPDWQEINADAWAQAEADPRAAVAVSSQLLRRLHRDALRQHLHRSRHR